MAQDNLKMPAKQTRDVAVNKHRQRRRLRHKHKNMSLFLSPHWFNGVRKQRRTTNIEVTWCLWHMHIEYVCVSEYFVGVCTSVHEQRFTDCTHVHSVCNIEIHTHAFGVGNAHVCRRLCSVHSLRSPNTKRFIHTCVYGSSNIYVCRHLCPHTPFAR